MLRLSNFLKRYGGRSGCISQREQGEGGERRQIPQYLYKVRGEKEVAHRYDSVRCWREQRIRSLMTRSIHPIRHCVAAEEVQARGFIIVSGTKIITPHVYRRGRI
jgi:hypothetical protein